jgi:hypothetical protein
VNGKAVVVYGVLRNDWFLSLVCDMPGVWAAGWLAQKGSWSLGVGGVTLEDDF